MKVGAPKEICPGENRVAITPDSAIQIQKLGHECILESGAGIASGFNDSDYKAAGVKIVKSSTVLWKEAEIIVKVRDPEPIEYKEFSCLLYTSPSPRDQRGSGFACWGV